MLKTSDFLEAAQTPEEARAFVEAFARVTVHRIKRELGTPLAEVGAEEAGLKPDWDDEAKALESGLLPAQIDDSTRAGQKYLHIDVAAAAAGGKARALFLALSGLSDKQQRALFPALRSPSKYERTQLSNEVGQLNAWLDEVRVGGFDPAAFITYQRSIGIHGGGQNLSGSIGAAGAAIAFIDAIQEISPGMILDTVGERPPENVRSPSEVYDWMSQSDGRTVKCLLLKNGRAIVFASSKDANIFMPLVEKFVSAADALREFTKVASNQAQRSQTLHEFAVGEVKTATDPANLHERMGLASRETQTELRTERFLMMALLNEQILTGGTQGRVLNNKDLTRFTHVFNLHHCWGWDGGRVRHPEHWEHFKASVKVWCGL